MEALLAFILLSLLLLDIKQVHQYVSSRIAFNINYVRLARILLALLLLVRVL